LLSQTSESYYVIKWKKSSSDAEKINASYFNHVTRSVDVEYELPLKRVDSFGKYSSSEKPSSYTRNDAIDYKINEKRHCEKHKLNIIIQATSC
jgi:hypothetical protein